MKTKGGSIKRLSVILLLAVLVNPNVSATESDMGQGKMILARSGFITPSDPRWSAAGGLQASRNAHPPQADCAFESACALPSGVIRGCETTSNVM